MHNKHTDISVNFFGRTSIVQFMSVLIFKDDPKLFIKWILLPAFDKVAYFIVSSLLVILSLGVYPENSMGKKNDSSKMNIELCKLNAWMV